MRKTFLLLPVFLLLLSGASCSRPGCAQKSGAVTRVARSTAPFSTIVLLDNIDLVLTQDSVCRVVIETDEALQPAVAVEVNGGELILRNDASCALIRRPGERIIAHVSLPDLNRFNYQGSGTVTCTDTLRLDYFSIEADKGAGDVRLQLQTIYTQAFINNEVTDFVFSGRSDTADVWCASRGTIDFRNFEVKRLGISYAGIRDAQVWASERLRAIVHGTGNIYYKGTPALQPDYRSSGRLLPAR